MPESRGWSADADLGRRALADRPISACVIGSTAPSLEASEPQNVAHIEPNNGQKCGVPQIMDDKGSLLCAILRFGPRERLIMALTARSDHSTVPVRGTLVP